MDWWIGELVKTLTLVILAFGLHRLIRGFGRSYTANIFDSTPQIGRVFLILADVAYYLIFAAYILFNIHFKRAKAYFISDVVEHVGGWGVGGDTVNASQLENMVFSIAGISLIVGILHGVNVFVLPFIGSILALRERLTERRQELPL